MNSRLRRLPLFALVLSLMACTAEAQESEGVIRAGIGMTTDEVRAGSTFLFPPRENGEIMLMTNGPHDFLVIEGGHELLFEDRGGLFNFSTIASEMDGRIAQIMIQPFRGPETVDAAIAETERLYDWFVSAGFQPPSEGVGFASRAWRDPRPRVLTFAQARDALIDPDARLESARIFQLCRPDGSATAAVEIRNARRVREVTTAGARRDESNAAREREYGVTLHLNRNDSGFFDECSER
jgi:hypothetical protein